MYNAKSILYNLEILSYVYVCSDFFSVTINSLSIAYNISIIILCLLRFNYYKIFYKRLL